MGAVPWKSDGRSVFNTEFKRTAVQRILTGEKTIAEFSRELACFSSKMRTWPRSASSRTAQGFGIPVQ
jgi:transposase-like protein